MTFKEGIVLAASACASRSSACAAKPPYQDEDPALLAVDSEPLSLYTGMYCGRPPFVAWPGGALASAVEVLARREGSSRPRLAGEADLPLLPLPFLPPLPLPLPSGCMYFHGGAAAMASGVTPPRGPPLQWVPHPLQYCVDHVLCAPHEQDQEVGAPDFLIGTSEP